jgi:hypothetical protein
MKSWMLPWLFPAALLVTVISVTVFKSQERLLLLAGGYLLAVLIGSIVFRPREGQDPEVDYWRIRRR